MKHSQAPPRRVAARQAIGVFYGGAAGGLLPEEMRTLDAIHLATAQQLGRDLGQIVTYDARMKTAADALGLKVAAPA